ncbi:unnamed protein product [Lymnaea stagnalis]|uniref:Uncharacterized protein n=1 Tax=Lymnaea stagnalis TaxID=6523 RepID=A0AAV2HWN8_LYMST
MQKINLFISVTGLLFMYPAKGDHCPKDFKVTSATADSISLSWQLISGGRLWSFFVFYTTDNVTWEDSDNEFDIIGDSMSLEIRSLKTNTDYWFKIASSEDEGPVQECNQIIRGKPEIPTTFQTSNTTTSLDVTTALETSTENSPVVQTSTKSSPPVHTTTTTTEGDPKIQDDLNNITTNYTDQTQTDERPSSSFHWTTTMDSVVDPKIQDDLNNITTHYTLQTQTDERASSSFHWTTTMDTVVVFCPEDSQEEVTFVQTRGGVTRQVPCPPNYEGNITRTCNHKTGSWTPFSQYNCTRKRLIIASNLANDLSNESSEVLKARVKDISSEVTSALEGNITIVSGEIKQIVNILEQIGIASNRSSVSNDTLQSLAAITDKLIEADTSTWDELSSANKTENAGSVLLKAMEDITSSYLHSANVTDTLIQEKNIVITVASTGQGRDNITFPKMDQATYNTNQTLNKVFLSSEALSGSVAYSVIIYMNVSDKFKVHSSSNESSQEQRIGTDVISFSLSSKSTSLSSPLILTFKTGESRDGAVCSFLDTKNEISGVWLSDGCKTILKETTIDCQCSHLTNFAVLMSMTRLSPDHHTILSYISVIGLSISLFFLCLTVTVYSVMWRYVKSDRSVLHINLCVCLMLGYTVFLGGISRTEHRVACAVAAALLHYLFLAVFFVMLSQGLLILKSVTSVSSVSILRYLYILMYGAPLVIVTTSLGITQGEGFGTDKACWLSPQTGVLWAFVGPALSIVVVNFFILFAVIRIMQKSRIMTDKDVKKKTKSVVRSIFILSPILGVTWVLGVLSVSVDLAIFQYSFAICNSVQGLFMFIFQCVLQYQIKDGFRALLRKYRATSFDSNQRMVNTGQSQEKGYSESGQKTTSITNTSGSYKSKE